MYSLNYKIVEINPNQKERVWSGGLNRMEIERRRIETSVRHIEKY